MVATICRSYPSKEIPLRMSMNISKLNVTYYAIPTNEFFKSRTCARLWNSHSVCERVIFVRVYLSATHTRSVEVVGIQ